MNTTIQVIGYVDSTGHLEIAQPIDLPAGEVVITIQAVTAEMIAADEALWDAQFARTPQVLAMLSAEVDAAIAEGTVEDFDPDTDTL